MTRNGDADALVWSERWAAVAERAVEALDVQDGEVVQVRDRTGRFVVVQELLLALERRGATPLPELLPPGYLSRLLATTAPEVLARWDTQRQTWLAQSNRVLVLAGLEEDLATAPAAAVEAWQGAVHRLVTAEEGRRLPLLVLAVPTQERARGLDLSLHTLEDLVVPALVAAPTVLEREAMQVLVALHGGRTLTLHSGASCTLHLDVGDRQWIADTGALPPATLRPSVQRVLNLPAGAVYTTVVEESVQGSLWAPRAGPARNATLRFAQGRVVDVAADEGGAALTALFNRHSGEPRRVSHIGIGLNPALQRALDWVLVDEHRPGAVLVGLGENRYLGGQNASSLNMDLAIPGATLTSDGRAIVKTGALSSA